MSNIATQSDTKTFFQNTLSLERETLYFGIMTIILVASFFNSFWWMPPQWLVENAYSPGPMAPVLFGIIIFFKFKQLDKKFKIPMDTIKFLGIPVIAFAAIFFFGTEHAESL